MGKIANRQSLVFSERSQLSQAIPQFHVERILHEWTPIARFESQRNEPRAYEDQIRCLGGRYELQRTLATRIAARTLASDSAITIARFRPSKERGVCRHDSMKVGFGAVLVGHGQGRVWESPSRFYTLIFHSLVFFFDFPWSLSNQGNSLVFQVFSAIFQGSSMVFTGFERGKKSLVFCVVFPLGVPSHTHLIRIKFPKHFFL